MPRLTIALCLPLALITDGLTGCAQLVMVMTTGDVNPSHAIKIPIRPGKGEIWFSINLQLIDDIPALYALLHQLDFQAPQFGWLQYPNGDTEIHLVLHHETRLRLEAPPNELFWEAQQQLANAIDTAAIRFAVCFTGKVA